MGIENLSIASSSFSRGGGYGVRVKEGAGVADARLVWSTIYGDEAQASFNVTVTAFSAICPLSRMPRARPSDV